jgi:hypothetical protein
VAEFLSSVRHMGPPPTRRLGIASYVLGAFICWQLLFLLVFNYLQIALGPIQFNGSGDKAASIERPARAVQEVELRWSELTGQYQAWWLFVHPLRDSTFPLVELRWHDSSRAPVRLYAFQEPTDPASYFRPPDVRDRRFHYDGNVCLVYNPWYAKAQEKEPSFDPDQYTDKQLKRFRDRWQPMWAYMKWRYELWRDEHPDVPPPQEVLFYHRVYPTAPHDAAWVRSPPEERPIARWRPGQEVAGFAPLEAYDPRKQAYIAQPLELTP